jgi:hypothetical protein
MTLEEMVLGLAARLRRRARAAQRLAARFHQANAFEAYKMCLGEAGALERSAKELKALLEQKDCKATQRRRRVPRS